MLFQAILVIKAPNYIDSLIFGYRWSKKLLTPLRSVVILPLNHKLRPLLMVETGMTYSDITRTSAKQCALAQDLLRTVKNYADV